MPFKRACGERFFLKKHGFLGLTPVYSETTVLMRVLTLEVSNANPELKTVLSVCIRS